MTDKWRLTCLCFFCRQSFQQVCVHMIHLFICSLLSDTSTASLKWLGINITPNMTKVFRFRRNSHSQDLLYLGFLCCYFCPTVKTEMVAEGVELMRQRDFRLMFYKPCSKIKAKLFKSIQISKKCSFMANSKCNENTSILWAPHMFRTFLNMLTNMWLFSHGKCFKHNIPLSIYPSWDCGNDGAYPSALVKHWETPWSGQS